MTLEKWSDEGIQVSFILQVLRLAVTTAAASSSSGSGTSDPMLKNVGKLMKEAQLDKMPPEEKQQLAKELGSWKLVE